MPISVLWRRQNGDPTSLGAPAPLASEARGFIRSIRRAAPVDVGILYVHLDTLSSKMCPAPFVEAVLTRFLTDHPRYIVLVVGARPHALNLGALQHRVFCCCGLELAESFAVVQGADLFLGVDSCMLHMADISRRPAVALFGPTAAHEFGFRFSPGAVVSHADVSSWERSVETALVELASRAA